MRKNKTSTKRTLRGPVLDSKVFADRRSRFLAKMLPDSVAIVVSNPEATRSNDTEFPYRQSSDVLYLSNFPEPESVLVLSNVKGVNKFIMFVRPKDRKQEIWTGIRFGVDGAKSQFGADEAYPVDQFEDVLGKLLGSAKNVYYKHKRNHEFDETFNKVWGKRVRTLRNPEEIVHELRVVKSSEELVVMRFAAHLAAMGHCEAMRLCRPGMAEYQLQATLESVFRFNGADYPAYGSIVAGGNNAVVLHYTQNDADLQDGDLVLIDAAAEYKGYASDITRTFPVNGKFSEAQRELYQLVLDSQMAAIRAAKPGRTLNQVHDAAARVLRRGLYKLGILSQEMSTKTGAKRKLKQLKKQGKEKEILSLGDFYMHGTSHWMGYDVHDVDPSGEGGRGNKARLLEPGMVFTIEPGLYFDKDDKRVPAKYRGIGIRIEDDVVVTESGVEIITHGVPKTIEEIEALMAEGQKHCAEVRHAFARQR